MTSYSPSLPHPYPYIISIITILPILIHSPRSYILLTYCRLRYIIQICNDYYGWFTETNGTYRILSNSNTCVSYNTFLLILETLLTDIIEHCRTLRGLSTLIQSRWLTFRYTVIINLCWIWFAYIVHRGVVLVNSCP